MEQEFDVEIKEVLSRVQKVKAESLDDAINKAMDMYYAEQMPANIVWNDLGIQIRAGSYHEFNCNLNLFGNFDEDEKYRITKKVYVNQKEYTLYADFTVN